MCLRVFVKKRLLCRLSEFTLFKIYHFYSMCFDLSKVGEFSEIKFYKELYRSLKLNKKIVVLSLSPQ